jgi:hypothetical protein
VATNFAIARVRFVIVLSPYKRGLPARERSTTGSVQT